MTEQSDLTRLRHEYASRQRRLWNSKTYSMFNVANLFIQQQRQRHVLNVLAENGINALSSQQVLEIGCGNGAVLQEWISLGARSPQLVGVDLLGDRLQIARKQAPFLSVACADAQNLPFPPAQFDLILQFTVFSSILDDAIKTNLAREMLRTLKPTGTIIWYDFWLNPTNPQTRGIRPPEIRALFPGCSYHFHRITLAPPLSRRIVPISWAVALLIEKMGFLNSHYLVAIQPKSEFHAA